MYITGTKKSGLVPLFAQIETKFMVPRAALNIGGMRMMIQYPNRKEFLILKKEIIDIIPILIIKLKCLSCLVGVYPGV